jgi:hypothetical protein
LRFFSHTIRCARFFLLKRAGGMIAVEQTGDDFSWRVLLANVEKAIK